MNGGLFRTIVNFIIAGLILTLMRSPIFMLFFGFASGVLFVYFFPEHAHQMITSISEWFSETASQIASPTTDPVS